MADITNINAGSQQGRRSWIMDSKGNTVGALPARQPKCWSCHRPEVIGSIGSRNTCHRLKCQFLIRRHITRRFLSSLHLKVIP